MQINLSPELEAIINSRVESGMYPTAGEVVRDALWLLADRDDIRARKIARLNHHIAIGLEQAARGELIGPEELEANLDRIIAEAEKNAEKL